LNLRGKKRGVFIRIFADAASSTAMRIETAMEVVREDD
jgi:hypothetical protein